MRHPWNDQWRIAAERRSNQATYYIQDIHAYEAYTCNKAGAELQCSWKPGTPFLDGPDEQELIERGQLPAAAALFALVDIDTGRPANFGMGSIAWNEYHKQRHEDLDRYRQILFNIRTR
ncbi:MAG: hypothetical protein LAP85_10890 [Acidobacteriia bacterium]|nr:hypothetical protein [Terriglobia bacterium]